MFHTVAKFLSFTKAADALSMTQPAVTFQIKQLEERSNAKLFDRGASGITLTAAGKLVLEYAEKILGLSEELDLRLKVLTDKISGELHIGASTTIAEFVLPPVLRKFRNQYPNVVPRLLVANSDAIQNLVAEHSIEFGFIETGRYLATVATDVFCEDELHVICAPRHPLAKLDAVTPATLLNFPFISREAGSGTKEVTDAYVKRSGIPGSLNTIMELGSPEAMRAIVAAGTGFAIVSSWTASKEIDLGQLVRIPLAPRLIRNFAVVYPRERFRSHLVSVFVDFAKQRLSSKKHVAEMHSLL